MLARILLAAVICSSVSAFARDDFKTVSSLSVETVKLWTDGTLPVTASVTDGGCMDRKLEVDFAIKIEGQKCVAVMQFFTNEEATGCRMLTSPSIEKLDVMPVLVKAYSKAGCDDKAHQIQLPVVSLPF